MLDAGTFWIAMAIAIVVILDLYYRLRQLRQEFEQFKVQTINEVMGINDRIDNNLRNDG